MEHTNVNSNGTVAVSSTRVPFTELVSPVREYGVVIAEALTSVITVVGRLFTGLRRWYAVNRTIRELQKLDDHMLADIGLSRSQIVAVAHSLGRTGRTGK